MNPKLCYGCNLPIEGRSHYHNTVPAGATSTCRELNQKKKWKDSNSRVRRQSAALNGGVPLGKSNKTLKTRLDFLTIRSYAEVAAEIGITASAVRLIEIRAFQKIRAALLPFKDSTCGEHKVRNVTQPL